MSLILAIESSCDETSAAVICDGKLLSNVVASQTVHADFGGVVPELASRAHQQYILPVVTQALDEAGVSKTDLDAVAFTRGPGLLGALLVGVSFAKGLALALRIPMIEVNHMEAHVLAHFIDDPKPEFPFLCLTVSGGHTQIVRVDGPTEMEVIGETTDDAAGEAFDKTAKIMGLPYPGGPLIDRYAKQGNPEAFVFPESKSQGLNFSFSGIKTAVRYFLQEKMAENPEFIKENTADICASVQYTIIKMLMAKLKRAAKETGIRRIALAGGVSANSGLRQSLKEHGEKLGWEIFIPDFQYCTDNAGMIAAAAVFKYEKGIFCAQNVAPLARMPIGTG